MAFESLVKLVAFLAVGILVSYFISGAGRDLSAGPQRPEVKELFLLNSSSPNSYGLFFVETILAMWAIIFLPRQFHLMVVENTDEKHILTAAWLLPLYLLIINIFVLPLACGGLLLGYPPIGRYLRVANSSGQRLPRSRLIGLYRRLVRRHGHGAGGLHNLKHHVAEQPGDAAAGNLLAGKGLVHWLLFFKRLGILLVILLGI